MDELRLLRHFEAVYRLSSFSAAAGELRLTHSAVTKSIKLLEDDWKTQLFHRTTRSVVPTEAGKKLYPQAVELLAFAASLRRSVSVDQREINILSGPGALEGFIHPAILIFQRRYPKTKINVAPTPVHLAAEELRQRRADILIYHNTSFALMPDKDRMLKTGVIDEPYLIIHRRGAPVASRSHSLKDLMLSYDWALAVSRSFEDFLPAELRKLVEQRGLPKYRLPSQSACIELVKQTDLLSAIPKSLAEGLVARGELAAIPFPADFRFAISAAVLDDEGREPAIEHFIQCLQTADNYSYP